MMNQLLNEILQLTSQSLQKAQEMMGITQEIKTYIHKEEVEDLNQALIVRQGLIDDIGDNHQKINENMVALYQQYGVKNIEDIDGISHPQRKILLHHRQQIQNVFKNIYELERQNQKKAQNLMEEYKKEIKNINQGKQAHQAYGRRTQGYSIMIDQFK